MVQPRRQQYQSKRNKRIVLVAEIMLDTVKLVEKMKAYKSLKLEPIKTHSEMRGADFVLPEGEKILSHHNHFHDARFPH